jgi:uncharacterized membrane protein
MAKDMSDTVRDALGQVVREAVKNVGPSSQPNKKNSSPLSGARGLAAGAGIAALAPLAKKGFSAVRGNGINLPSPKPGKMAAKATSKAAKTVGDKVGGKLKEGVSDKVDEAGGAGGLVKDAASGLLPGGGDSGGGKGGMPGVGKGRRMPVQQSVDVAVPVETAYNQFTQFEDWAEFMHRVTRVTQEDDCTVSFATKIWTRTREFKAEIETQRPDERIKWKVSEGITHTGVVTFHELAPRLTRIELNMDVEPGGMIEKAARGMRHVKRAARADLHRFKAFIEMQEIETGAWRGVIEDGELVEEHPEDYDQEREYSDVEDLQDQSEGDEDRDEEDEEDQEDQEDEDQDEDQRSRSQRFKRQAERTSSRSGGGSSKSGSSKSGSSRSRSGSSGGGGGNSSGGSRSQASSRGRSRSRGSSNGGDGSSSKKSGSSSGGRRKSSSRN